MNTKKLKKGMKVRCPLVDGRWATVKYVSPEGRVEIRYSGDRYDVEVDADKLTY
jgi:hypothetical protein